MPAVPLRVAFVSQTYHPVVGGTERQLQHLLPRLTARGIEPLVITRGMLGVASDDAVDGVRVIRCGSVRYGALGSLVFCLKTLWTLHRWKPDVVHAFSLMTPATIGAVHRSVGGSPLLVKVLRGGTRGDLDRIRHKPFYRLRCRLLREGIDAAQIISDEIDAELASIDIPRERRHRISNGVDLTALASAGDGTRLRASLGIARDAPLFVYVGRLVPEKRIDLLVDAFERVRATHPRARLLVVGDGPERDRLELAAEGNPAIVAFGRTENVAAVLAATSVYVQPSSTEGMSNSLLEAMAAGVPIVATEVGAARELLGADERGWVVPPDDEAALHEAMLAALNERPARERGARAKRHVTAHHDLHDSAERLVRVYRTLAAEAIVSASFDSGGPGR